jgi:DNA-binding NarL/FixJ family response regulator
MEAIPELRSVSPETAIVVLTMEADPTFAREALRAGALGYLLKEAAHSELVEAVRTAARGEQPHAQSLPHPETYRQAAPAKSGVTTRMARRTTEAHRTIRGNY